MRSMTRAAGLVAGVLGWAVPGAVEAKEIWVAPTHFQAPALNTFPWSVTGAGYASFTFAVPHDFRSLRSLTLALVPKSDVNATFDVYGSVKREGEAAADEPLFTLGVPAVLTANTLQEVDLASLLAGALDASSAGTDYVSLFFYFPGSPGIEKAHVVGLRFAYEPALLAGSDLADDSVTHAKLADDAVGTAKVQDGSLSGLDIADGSLRREDIDRDEVQARVAGACPEGQSIRAISDTGDVRCQSIGLRGYGIETHTEACFAGMFPCEISASCPTGKKITGGGYTFPATDLNSVLTVDVIDSFPDTTHSWTVRAYHTTYSSLPVQITTYAICSSEGETLEPAAPARKATKAAAR